MNAGSSFDWQQKGHHSLLLTGRDGESLPDEPNETELYTSVSLDSFSAPGALLST